MLDMNFINTCISLEVEGNKATAVREIDGGRETLETTLPLIVGGQKGLVEETDLRIPNMRGIMMARQKKLTVVPPVDGAEGTSDVRFEKPEAKGPVKLVDKEQLDQLIELLHKEAKVI
jgi:electron transfer flavoprotein beta subunit